MIPILILLLIVSLLVPVIVNILKKFLKIPVKVLPLLPLALGIAIGIIFFFIPRLALSLKESILFGIASGGTGVIIYDFISGLKPEKK